MFEEKFRDLFISRCVTYYLYLRKHAKVILNLMHLMIDSNLITNPKKNKKLDIEAVKEMAEKFSLEKDEVEAEEFFKIIINRSVEAVLTNLWDRIHYIKAKWK